MHYFKRNCPCCNVELKYKQKYSCDDAVRRNRKCMSCAKKGSIPWNKGNFNGEYKDCKSIYCNNQFYVEPREIHDHKTQFCSLHCAHYGIYNNQYGRPGTMTGKKHTKKTIEKMKKSAPDMNGVNHPQYGISKSMESNKKRSEKMSGKNHWNYGGKHYGPKKHSNESIMKMRVSTIAQLEKNIKNGGQIIPNYNPEACKIIEQYGKEHGYNFQHAENGGEYHIKELGYWADGYDEEKNVVIEYYEPFHKKQIERDERRKQEIIDHLNCKFIIIGE